MISSKSDLKSRACETIDARRGEIIRLGQVILENPELGFKEVETARLAARNSASWVSRPENDWLSPGSRR